MYRPSIFITGASRGIGLAIARKFYEEDFEVAICSRNPENLDAAREEMPGLHTFVCDISDKTDVKICAAKVRDLFGSLDVLVNNGGTFLPGKLHEEPDEVFERLMATNLNSAYYFTKVLLPPMIARGRGTIFNICSVASIKAYANGGSYGVSKYALLGFSKNLREELKPHHIRVVSVLPGAVITDSWASSGLPEERFIPPEDIASLVWNAYSLSPRTVVEDIVVRPALGDI
ncbi:MAG: SDR family oxidoreductase [Bacteroidetes bacterium]|nr:MAG: SDR family oxidoreductase [Bacteroidota bacterium]